MHLPHALSDAGTRDGRSTVGFAEPREQRLRWEELRAQGGLLREAVAGGTGGSQRSESRQGLASPSGGAGGCHGSQLEGRRVEVSKKSKKQACDNTCCLPRV